MYGNIVYHIDIEIFGINIEIIHLSMKCSPSIQEDLSASELADLTTVATCSSTRCPVLSRVLLVHTSYTGSYNELKGERGIVSFEEHISR